MMPVVLGMHVYCLFVFRVSNRKCNPSIYIIGNEQRAQDLLWLWLDFPISISMFIGMHYVWFSQFWSHFHRGNVLFASKAKINIFWKKFEWSGPWPEEWEKNSKDVDWGNRTTTQNTFFDIFMWDQNHENHT